jgi:ElaB/YqjD/DUF883 family membrane-anchored ribosome-binding protein
MQINATEAVRNMLSYTLATDRDSLIKLLERNGVVVPQNPSDREVTAAVLLASAKSTNFKQELSKLLTSKFPNANKDYASFVGDSSDFGFTGIDDFSFVGEDEFFGANGTPTSKDIRSTRKAAKTTVKLESAKKGEKTGFGKFLSNLGQAVSSPDTLNAGLNIGLTAVNNRVQGRSNALQQETAVITQQSDQIKQELGRPTGRLSTGAIIGIVVGVVAVIGIVYYVAKKK